MIKLVELVRVSLGEIKYKRMYREKRQTSYQRKRKERRERSNFWREGRAQFSSYSDCTVPKTDCTAEFSMPRSTNFKTDRGISRGGLKDSFCRNPYQFIFDS